MTPRLLIVASHPVQYFVPIYRHLARNGRLDVRVAYCREYGVRPTYDKQFGSDIQWDVDLLGGYDHVFLKNVSPISNTFNPLHAINPTVAREVLRGVAAVWVNGLIYPTNWLAIATARARRIPILMRSELHPDALAGDALRSRLKRGFYRQALRWVDGVLAIGAQNRQAYETVGVAPANIDRARYVVDTQRFDVSEAERAERRARRRAAWGLADDDIAVVFLGKFTRRKHPELLLELDRASVAGSLALVWVGAGEMESELREASKRLAHARPVFAGLANQSEIPDVLWAGDIFAFPSEAEPWGLVLNEAMAAGLPAVVSTEVGSAADLCIEGVTGHVVPPNDAAAFVRAVETIASSPDLRRAMGEAARRHVADWTPEAVAREIEDAALRVIAARNPGAVAP